MEERYSERYLNRKKKQVKIIHVPHKYKQKIGKCSNYLEFSSA